MKQEGFPPVSFSVPEMPGAKLFSLREQLLWGFPADIACAGRKCGDKTGKGFSGEQSEV